jgi:hypothetical protein
MAYTRVLKSQDGRLWCDQHKYNLRIAVHIFQDIQHIIGLFLNVAASATLKHAIREGTPIDIKNFWNCAQSADALTNRLRQAITGNGLGDFQHEPVCLSWFLVEVYLYVYFVTCFTPFSLLAF